MSKRAFIVLGPESSGTKLTAGLLIGMGCEGSSTHYQTLESGVISGDLVMIRRSVPHGGKDLDLVRLLARLRGYSICCLVVIRDEYATCASQVKHKHQLSVELAREKYREAYLDIYGQIRVVSQSRAVDHTTVVYESLVLDAQGSIARLAERLKLPTPFHDFEIRNGNAPHWQRSCP